MNLTQEGDRLYLYSITTVAILGGLLFGYDTAVISGAEKGLEAFFLTATDFQYDKVMHGITSSSALIGCVIGVSSNLYVLSVKRAENRSDDRRVGYYWPPVWGDAIPSVWLPSCFSSPHWVPTIRSFFSSNTERPTGTC